MLSYALLLRMRCWCRWCSVVLVPLQLLTALPALPPAAAASNEDTAAGCCRRRRRCHRRRCWWGGRCFCVLCCRRAGTFEGWEACGIGQASARNDLSGAPPALPLAPPQVTVNKATGDKASGMAKGALL